MNIAVPPVEPERLLDALMNRVAESVIILSADQTIRLANAATIRSSAFPSKSSSGVRSAI